MEGLRPGYYCLRCQRSQVWARIVASMPVRWLNTYEPTTIDLPRCPSCRQRLVYVPMRPGVGPLD